jgi:2-oxoisovalerate dehydrogenase E1 component beta subunit
MAEVTLVEAVNLALARALSDDPNVIVLGEDVGVNGGVFRATVGLQQRFGPQRVVDTPLAELLISGLCVGMAAQGLRPVGEIQFMGFIYPCIDQLVNHASRLRNRTRGRLSCPMVLRTPHGGGIHAPEHHSESTEVMLAHIPGLRVVIPSSPERAYGLLLAAIRDPDPAGLTSLLAPVVRVTGYDTVIPLPRLEQHYMPSVNRIAAAARKVCQFS